MVVRRLEPLERSAPSGEYKCLSQGANGSNGAKKGALDAATTCNRTAMDRGMGMGIGMGTHGRAKGWAGVHGRFAEMPPPPSGSLAMACLGCSD